MILLYVYLLIINALGFLFMLMDKIKAIRHQRRIPEKVLLCVGFSGGSMGCTLAMVLFRHKTRKLKFRIGFPLLLCLHLIILFFLHILL